MASNERSFQRLKDHSSAISGNCFYISGMTKIKWYLFYHNPYTAQIFPRSADLDAPVIAGRFE